MSEYTIVHTAEEFYEKVKESKEGGKFTFFDDSPLRVDSKLWNKKLTKELVLSKIQILLDQLQHEIDIPPTTILPDTVGSGFMKIVRLQLILIGLSGCYNILIDLEKKE